MTSASSVNATFKAKYFVFGGGKSHDQLTAAREDVLPLNISLESPDDLKVIIAESTDREFKAVTPAGGVRKPVHDVEDTIEPLLPTVVGFYMPGHQFKGKKTCLEHGCGLDYNVRPPSTKADEPSDDLYFRRGATWEGSCSCMSETRRGSDFVRCRHFDGRQGGGIRAPEREARRPGASLMSKFTCRGILLLQNDAIPRSTHPRSDSLESLHPRRTNVAKRTVTEKMHQRLTWPRRREQRKTPRVERMKETRSCANCMSCVTFVILEGSQKKSLPESRQSLQRFSALLNDLFYEVRFSVYVSNPVCVHSCVASLVSFWFLLTVFRFSGVTVLFAFQSRTLEESSTSAPPHPAYF